MPPALCWFSPGQMPQYQLKQVLGCTKSPSLGSKAAHAPMYPTSPISLTSPISPSCTACSTVLWVTPGLPRLPCKALPPSLTCQNFSLPITTFAAAARMFARWEGGDKVLVCPASSSQFWFCPSSTEQCVNVCGGGRRLERRCTQVQVSITLAGMKPDDAEWHRAWHCCGATGALSPTTLRFPPHAEPRVFRGCCGGSSLSDHGIHHPPVLPKREGLAPSK